MMKCICPGCPTFQKNDLTDGTYCAMGEKKPEMKGCNCLSCPLYAEYNLSGAYFCIHGAAD
jgi:hypothetical protein